MARVCVKQAWVKIFSIKGLRDPLKTPLKWLHPDSSPLPYLYYYCAVVAGRYRDDNDMKWLFNQFECIL